MPSVKSLAAHIESHSLPFGQNIVEKSHGAFSSPEDQNRALHFLLKIIFFMLKVNCCTGAVILAHGVELRRICEAAEIMAKASR